MRPGQGIGHRRAVAGSVTKRLGQTPQDLRQDDPGVAPGAHQRAVADGGAHRAQVGPVAIAELGHHRLQRQRHVGPGVAVGDRIDVQPVDRLLMGPQGVPVGHHHRSQVVGSEALERPHKDGDANLYLCP